MLTVPSLMAIPPPFSVSVESPPLTVNPDSVASADPRLSELRDIYGEGMPPLKMADPIAREKLARYVLR